MITWLKSVIENMSNDRIRTRILLEESTSILLSIVSPVFIDSNKVGGREMIIYGVYSLEEKWHQDILQVLNEHLARYGVLWCFLVSNKIPSDELRQILTKHQIVFVKIEGDEFPITPNTDTFASSISKALLGSGFYQRMLNDVDSIAPHSQKVIEREELISNLRQIIGTLYFIYLAEHQFFEDTESLGDRVMTGTDGTEDYLSLGYAVHAKNFPEAQLQCYIPTAPYIHNALHRLIDLYRILLNIQTINLEFPEICSELEVMTRNAIGYYINWLDGTEENLNMDKLVKSLANIRDEKFINIFLGNLAKADPLEQIASIRLMGSLKAKNATSEVLNILSTSSNSKVHQACMEALIEIGTCTNPELFIDFATSPREYVQDSALSLIASMKSENAAKALINLLANQQIPLSRNLLMAIGSTGTISAIGFLLSIYPELKGDVILLAIEKCLIQLAPPSGYYFQHSIEVDKDWLLGICHRLYKSTDYDIVSKRLALKLIGFFKLKAGYELIEQAFEDESIRTRLSAIRSCANFPDDLVVDKLVATVINQIDYYNQRRVPEFFYEMFEKQSGRSISAEYNNNLSYDVHTVLINTLNQIGSQYALKEAEKLETQVLETDSDVINQVVNRDINLKEFVYKSMESNSIYQTPNDIPIWTSDNVGVKTKNDDDKLIAFIMHNGKEIAGQNLSSSAGMIGGGYTMTMGSRKQIKEDVVLAMLRGEAPKLPVTPAMGEVLSWDKDNLPAAHKLGES